MSGETVELARRFAVRECGRVGIREESDETPDFDRGFEARRGRLWSSNTPLTVVPGFDVLGLDFLVSRFGSQQSLHCVTSEGVRRARLRPRFCAAMCDGNLCEYHQPSRRTELPAFVTEGERCGDLARNVAVTSQLNVVASRRRCRPIHRSAAASSRFSSRASARRLWCLTGGG